MRKNNIFFYHRRLREDLSKNRPGELEKPLLLCKTALKTKTAARVAAVF